MHARRCEHGSARERRHLRRFNHSLALAEAMTQSQASGLILMHGVTDGARTDMAMAVAGALQAVVLRYDAELSRIGQPTPAGKNRAAGLASHAESYAHRIYETLSRSVADVVRSGYLAVVDAPCLLRVERNMLARSARAAGAAVVVVTTHPSEALLRAVWIAEFAPPDIQNGEGRLLRVERELCRMESIAPAEELTVVDLDAHGVTPKVLERIRDALIGREKADTAPPPRTETEHARAVPEMA
jgi:predicted kinase